MMKTIQNQIRTTAVFIFALTMLVSCVDTGKKIMQKAAKKNVEKELAELRKRLPMNVGGTNILITDVALEDDIVAYTVKVDDETWSQMSLDPEVTNSDRNLARVLASVPESSVTQFVSLGLGLKYLYISSESGEVLGNLKLNPQKLKDVWEAMKSGKLKAFTLIELSQKELDKMELPSQVGDGVWITDAYIRGHDIYYVAELEGEIDPEDISSADLADMKQGCIEGVRDEQVIMMREKEMFSENIHLIYIYKDSRGKEFARVELSPSDIFAK